MDSSLMCGQTIFVFDNKHFSAIGQFVTCSKQRANFMKCMSRSPVLYSFSFTSHFFANWWNISLIARKLWVLIPSDNENILTTLLFTHEVTEAFLHWFCLENDDCTYGLHVCCVNGIMGLVQHSWWIRYFSMYLHMVGGRYLWYSPCAKSRNSQTST